MSVKPIVFKTGVTALPPPAAVVAAARTNDPIAVPESTNSLAFIVDLLMEFARSCREAHNGSVMRG
jgi:hypothetical protein